MFADFVELLVESCLWKIVLLAWDHNRALRDTGDSKTVRSLEKLMSFIRHKVESEEMIALARKGFEKLASFKRNRHASDPSDAASIYMIISTNSDNRTFIEMALFVPESDFKGCLLTT
ncbi:unnamed protein product [Larinioides sclopetarius]|uniref:Uncharacterized protein n=1 Tax=Larinioides sclopetarius TaxID=280406 RepID=A0AAV1ZXC5_9ARAC